MATDGLSLFACIRELQGLVGGKIDKVQQPNKDIIILHIHAPAIGRVKLMICIHAENGRIQLTTHHFENPETAPAFCMLLHCFDRAIGHESDRRDFFKRKERILR